MSDLDIRERIMRHLRQLAPHVKERESAKLMVDALNEIDKLRLAIAETLDENAHLNVKLITLLFFLLMLAALIVGVLFNLEPICREVGTTTVCY